MMINQKNVLLFFLVGCCTLLLSLGDVHDHEDPKMYTKYYDFETSWKETKETMEHGKMLPTERIYNFERVVSDFLNDILQDELHMPTTDKGNSNLFVNNNYDVDEILTTSVHVKDQKWSYDTISIEKPNNGTDEHKPTPIIITLVSTVITSYLGHNMTVDLPYILHRIFEQSEQKKVELLSLLKENDVLSDNNSPMSYVHFTPPNPQDSTMVTKERTISDHDDEGSSGAYDLDQHHDHDHDSPDCYKITAVTNETNSKGLIVVTVFLTIMLLIVSCILIWVVGGFDDMKKQALIPCLNRVNAAVLEMKKTKDEDDDSEDGNNNTNNNNDDDDLMTRVTSASGILGANPSYDCSENMPPSVGGSGIPSMLGGSNGQHQVRRSRQSTAEFGLMSPSNSKSGIQKRGTNGDDESDMFSPLSTISNNTNTNSQFPLGIRSMRKLNRFLTPDKEHQEVEKQSHKKNNTISNIMNPYNNGMMSP